MSGLADLDELILRCRDRHARSYIAEAVACYRGSAYKSAIVATWVAVVYDFLGKLQELTLTGDRQAKALWQEFESARTSNELTKLLAFERDLLQRVGVDLELISHLELRDLLRLYEDRNRCAHPSVTSGDEPFEPVAELARYHLHTAVSHVLSLPPVQGRQALNIVWDMIKSDLFPDTQERAQVQLRASPLARARRTFIRDVVNGLLVNLLKESREEPERNRQFAALSATLEMHRHIAEEALGEKLNTLAPTLEIDHFPSLIELLARVPEATMLLNEAGQQRCDQFLREAETAASPHVLRRALAVKGLRKAARSRLAELSSVELSKVVADLDSAPDRALIDAALNVYANSKSFSGTRWNTRNLLMPLLPHLSPEHLVVVLQAARENRQIYEENDMAHTLLKILNSGLDSTEETKGEWKALCDKIEGESHVDENMKGLAVAIRDKWPD